MKGGAPDRKERKATRLGPQSRAVRLVLLRCGTQQEGPSLVVLAGKHLPEHPALVRGGPHLPRVGAHGHQLLWQVGAGAREGGGEGLQQGGPQTHHLLPSITGRRPTSE